MAAPLRGHDGAGVAAVAGLIAAGLVLAFAASQAGAERLGAEGPFAFVARQGMYAMLGLAVFAGAASLSPIGVRRAGVLLFAVALVLAVGVLIAGVEVGGARRWIRLFGLSLQPAELLKPGFVVTAAWVLSESMRRPGFPGAGIACALFALCALVLVPQPDLGQTALIGLSLFMLLALASVGGRWLIGAAAAGAGLAGFAYLAFPHARGRVAGYLSGESYQVERALEAIASGGLLGRGPGEGTVKDHLPDAHSDFIYALAAEEFGLIASLGLLALFAALVLRGLARARRLVDPFAQLAAGGLFAMVGMQALLHVAVNVALAPAKGVTLPLVSFGGSSMLGACLMLGFAFALCRERPGAFLYQQGGRA